MSVFLHLSPCVSQDHSSFQQAHYANISLDDIRRLYRPLGEARHRSALQSLRVSQRVLRGFSETVGLDHEIAALKNATGHLHNLWSAEDDDFAYYVQATELHEQAMGRSRIQGSASELYFPEEYTLAIYLPLWAPLVLPLLLSCGRELRALRSVRS